MSISYFGVLALGILLRCTTAARRSVFYVARAAARPQVILGFSLTSPRFKHLHDRFARGHLAGGSPRHGSVPTALLKLEAWDILDPTRAAGVRPLTDLLSEWGESLRAAERTERHVTQHVGRVRATFSACGFLAWSDIRPEPFERHLRALRQGDPTAVERHARAMSAHGRQLMRTLGRGLSPETSNHLLHAARGFCRWAVSRG